MTAKDGVIQEILHKLPFSKHITQIKDLRGGVFNVVGVVTDFVLPKPTNGSGLY